MLWNIRIKMIEAKRLSEKPIYNGLKKIELRHSVRPKEKKY